MDDVVTFPGRMYAFVNYRNTVEAVAAFDALQDQVVPELTGDNWRGPTAQAVLAKRSSPRHPYPRPRFPPSSPPPQATAAF